MTSSALLAALLAFFGANPDPLYQGYGEGDYVLVAPQVGGRIETLNVTRGQTVHKGDSLFTLEQVAEQASLDQAKAQVERADATLADLIKAKRQPELDTLIAQRDEANAALKIAELNLARDEKQAKVQAISQAALDSSRAVLDQAKARLAAAEAALTGGQTSIGRDDAIKAAQADLASAQAALAQAQWRLDQKQGMAAADATVTDTIYRAGEIVKDGQPVVSLLPPQNIRVRFFMPATALGKVSAGTPVTVHLTGQDTLPAHISYIAPQAEYAPPELYNRDNREKLLFMLEATPDVTPEKIHPGQPVDVEINERHE